MDTLWAPWRIGYIVDKTPSSECLFCAVSAENAHDAAHHIVYRGTYCFVMLNRYPYNNGHLMIVPYVHVPSIEELSEAIMLEMMTLAQRSLRCLQDQVHPGGFNLGINQGAAAGAGIADHVHLHIVPRWVGDTNFMATLADTRVIAQSLESCYAILVQAFQSYGLSAD